MGLRTSEYPIKEEHLMNNRVLSRALATCPWMLGHQSYCPNEITGLQVTRNVPSDKVTSASMLTVGLHQGLTERKGYEERVNGTWMWIWDITNSPLKVERDDKSQCQSATNHSNDPWARSRPSGEGSGKQLCTQWSWKPPQHPHTQAGQYIPMNIAILWWKLLIFPFKKAKPKFSPPTNTIWT